MKLLTSYSDTFGFILHKGNLYLGGQDKLIEISKNDNKEKIIKHNGRINVMKEYFNMLFFQESSKEVFVFNGICITKPFIGDYGLRNSKKIMDKVWLNRLETSKKNNQSSVLCSFNKELNIKRTDTSTKLRLPYIGNVLFKGFRETITGFDISTFKKKWELDVSNMGVRFHGSEERKNELARGLSNIILPFKNNLIMALAGGQVLSIYAKTGEVNWFKETRVRKQRNGITQLSIVDNKIYGHNAHYLVELDADTGKELRRLHMEEAINQSIFMNQLSVFEEYIIGYTPFGNMVIVNRHTFKIEEIFQCAGSIPNSPNHVIWFNNCLYILSSDLFIEPITVDSKVYEQGVVRKEAVLVYGKG